MTRLLLLPIQHPVNIFEIVMMHDQLYAVMPASAGEQLSPRNATTTGNQRLLSRLVQDAMYVSLIIELHWSYHSIQINMHRRLI